MCMIPSFHYCRIYERCPIQQLVAMFDQHMSSQRTGRTIRSWKWPIKNARLLARPTAGWLTDLVTPVTERADEPERSSDV